MCAGEACSRGATATIALVALPRCPAWTSSAHAAPKLPHEAMPQRRTETPSPEPAVVFEPPPYPPPPGSHTDSPAWSSTFAPSPSASITHSGAMAAEASAATLTKVSVEADEVVAHPALPRDASRLCQGSQSSSVPTRSVQVWLVCAGSNRVTQLFPSHTQLCAQEKTISSSQSVRLRFVHARNVARRQAKRTVSATPSHCIAAALAPARAA